MHEITPDYITEAIEELADGARVWVGPFLVEHVQRASEHAYRVTRHDGVSWEPQIYRRSNPEHLIQTLVNVHITATHAGCPEWGVRWGQEAN